MKKTSRSCLEYTEDNIRFSNMCSGVVLLYTYIASRQTPFVDVVVDALALQNAAPSFNGRLDLADMCVENHICV